MSTFRLKPMRSSESVLDYFFKQNEFEIPLYQRNYDWTKKNCEILFDDILDIHKVSEMSDSEEKYRKHFFGIVICLIDQHTGHRAIIDGQQRVTSVALLLAAIRDTLVNGEIESQDDKLGDKIDRRLRDQDDGTIFIRPIEKDRIVYDAIITDDVILDDYRGSNILKNYEYFKKRILRLDGITIDQFMECLKNLNIVPIHLSSMDDDAQKVFESINSTGLSLTEGDKIRNYMLMNHTPENQRRYYERYWTKIDDGSINTTNFIRDYLTAVTGIIPQMGNVYDDFKKYVKFRRINEKCFVELFEELTQYSRYYRNLKKNNLNYISEDASVLMFRINYQKATVIYPFLMKILNYHEAGNLTNEEVVEVLNITENYILRRLICKLPTNTLNKVFNNLFHTLIKDDSGDFTERLKHALLKRGGTAEYPKDEDVLYHLTETDLYSRRAVCTHVLATIEHANRDSQDTLIRITDGKLTVEHVMPQTLSKEWIEQLGDDYKDIHETWLHRLGNLTLTAYNSKYSNKSYKFKRNLEDSGFRESRLWLNRMMAENDEWTENLIQERNIFLANRFIKIMPEFSSSYEPPAEIDDMRVYSLNEDDDEFNGIKVTGFIFDGERHVAKSAMDAYLQMLKMFYDLDSVKFKAVEGEKGPGRAGIWISSNPAEDKEKEWGYVKIVPGMWTYKALNNPTKAKILRDFAIAYDFKFSDVAFIAKRK